MIPQNSLYHRSIQAFSRARTGFPVRWKSLFRNIGKAFCRLCVRNMLMSNGLRFCFISLCTCRCSVVRCLLHDSQSLDVIRIFLLIPPYYACLRFDSGTWDLSSLYIRFWNSLPLVLCCAVAVWIKNITCANAHLLQSAKNSLILNLSSYRKSCLLTCLPVLHTSSDMLPSSFLTLLHDGVRHIIDKDANLYVWLRHEILMKYDVVIWVKYNSDSSWKTSFVSVRVNIMALWKRQ